MSRNQDRITTSDTVTEEYNANYTPMMMWSNTNEQDRITVSIDEEDRVTTIPIDV